MDSLTLKDAYQGRSDLDFKHINRQLLALHQMSVLQANIMQDIEEQLNKGGKFRYKVKQNHKQIAKLIKEHFRLLWGNLSPEQTDAFCEDADEFEKIVFKFFEIE